MSNNSPIRFYRVGDPYGEFSNFAPYPILVDDVEWPTSEHYFQSQKFKGTPFEVQIHNATSPMQAAKMGRNRTWPLRQDWDKVKEDVMRRALGEKFSQHQILANILLSTGDAEIIEHTANDFYWADGGDGTGLNRLGQLLMEIRGKLSYGRNNESTG